ncbi:MAG: cytochrome c biogenesis protein [Salibacteraceae bacterium]|nr:cytochrome c biogenesis protein [Salibacteraceae bacterium]MDP4687474.1 cytochrome c biogenesis protein [Salibacteraceae bacterium]MDP4844030.1 cytochrome c biogenesis protein [Salibacteraceae bacterium]MDP4933653.1 cytochrome c biogenesis protein [Salibacteraceae bacterium]MDP4963862.1 cytochrome c biogenesis protein [Salibacteraceae bacterium]
MKLPIGFKIAAIVLVIYTLIAGLLMPVPTLAILNETIRNLYYHVTSWFAMITMFIMAFAYSIAYLNTQKEKYDTLAKIFVQVGMVFGIIGLVTGMLWARFTWGSYWVSDPKLNGAAIALLAYLAYAVLRNSFQDQLQRAKVSAVYNIFAFVMMILFVFILPRMTDSLHPGNGGNPAFSGYDLDSTMRMVFYPAVIGWILLGFWISELRFRIEKLSNEEL